MSRVLEVWLLGQHVGQLAQVDGRLSFCYSTQWLQSANARPLSHHLPLQAEAFDDKAARPFFAGLLPEGDKRRLIALLEAHGIEWQQRKPIALASRKQKSFRPSTAEKIALFRRMKNFVL